MNQESFTLSGTGAAERVAWIIGVAGIALSVVGYFTQSDQFFFSWLVAFVFWTSIALGGLFFTLLHHLTHSTWSIVLRRLFETTMRILPFMIVLLIPVFLGMHNLYHWSHADAVAHDELLHHKAPFLNIPFFIIRSVVYFAIWAWLGFSLYKMSLVQDKHSSPELTRRMHNFSAPGVVLFAFTTGFAAFDWLMSLDPHWYSTIFGVYYYAGSAMAFMAFMIVVVMQFRHKGILKSVISEEHDHDLGKLLFTFMVFWAYMAFSQYFLIWYGNIVEETVWFSARWVGSWKFASLMLAIGSFAVPFLILMIRSVKRNPHSLLMMAIWLLIMHWLDMYWLAMPVLHPDGMVLSWIDATTMLGMGGLFVGLFLTQLRKQPIVPVGDPRLQDSIHFINQ